MVSSNSQAIWCALYKQSPGDEGWEVLGMINNYQVNMMHHGWYDNKECDYLRVMLERKMTETLGHYLY